MLFIVNMLIKTDSTVTCVPCTVCLNTFVMSHFLEKIADLENIQVMLIG